MNVAIGFACLSAAVVLGLLLRRGGIGRAAGSMVCVVAGVALALVANLTWTNASLNSRASHWPTVSGTVVSSKVVRSWSSDSDSGGYYEYSPLVTYEYVVDGQSYQASSITTADTPGRYEWAHPMTLKYPPEKQLTVYVNPDDPSYALLEPGNQLWFGSMFTLITLGIMGAVLGIFLFGMLGGQSKGD